MTAAEIYNKTRLLRKDTYAEFVGKVITGKQKKPRSDT